MHGSGRDLDRPRRPGLPLMYRGLPRSSGEGQGSWSGPKILTGIVFVIRAVSHVKRVHKVCVVTAVFVICFCA